MESSALLVLISIGYMGLLFVVAWLGDRHFNAFKRNTKNMIYGLSLAVYCSSWSFLGTVGMSADSLLSYIPIYAAPILLFIFCFPLLTRILKITREQRITSIADFIASRYGKSQALAAIITLIAVIGTLPYFALQLKAIVNTFYIFDTQTTEEPWLVGLGIAFILAIFTILFGTRKLDATEHHPGLMLAIAFESVVKLVAFLLIGFVVCYVHFDGFTDIWNQAKDNNLINHESNLYSWSSLFAQTVVMMAAFLCMPREFHTMMVESDNEEELKKSRWVFPTYLFLAGLFVLPIALAGKLILDPSISADTYVISLPLALGFENTAFLGFLGAVSAATGMVIVAALTISIMVSNEWVVPLLLRTGSIEQGSFSQFSRKILNIRRLVILIVLGLGWLFYNNVSYQNSLANLGQISFGVFIQILPGLIGAVYWKHGNRKGVYIGLVVGLFIWFYTLFKPMKGNIDLLHSMEWLSEIQPSYNWIFVSLAVNCMFYIWGSLIFRSSVRERMQAGVFVDRLTHEKAVKGAAVSEQELLMLASRFIGRERALDSYHAFDGKYQGHYNWNKAAGTAFIDHTELLLSSVIGTSSASLVMHSVLEGRDMPLDDLVELIDEASSKILTSQKLMQSAIEHASEGMSVIDEHHNLMAWNQRYADLFNYPPGFLEVGKPIAELIRFNSLRGFCGEGNVEDHVSRRMERVKQGISYYFERTRPDGKVIKMQGNPMPNGGFVTTFSDITQYREVERELVRAKEELEARVLARTMELELANENLTDAKAKVDQVNLSKTRFMAAIGHDLMQPLNAARLFTASLLQHESAEPQVQETVRHIADSLKASGQLLADLLDISKLESDAIEVNVGDFAVSELLNNFDAEFGAMAADYSVSFKTVSSSAVVHSDINLLRRIVQNFLTNAFRYGSGGKVLLGCRHVGNTIRIEVWDQGKGIPQDKVKEIFCEFQRLENSSVYDRNGLGLGLAIADRISKVLGHELSLRSEVDRGSVFAITVPIVKNYKPQAAKPLASLGNTQLAGVKVLCIDNEEKILVGLDLLLQRWKCEVLLAESLEHAITLIEESGELPDVMLADFHLDDDKTGLDAMEALREKYQHQIPGVLITADTRKELVEEVESKNYRYMAKMVRPAALRAVISGLI
ncbi:PAS domain-containing hybrid sensor histidine kinase/response regulator [Psychrobium sp. 1_MG-2023]|uniref:hybrid sensor histidine kinase/response regulator n=1 Tax=Psychrobium sp. 1_MG-2023 TaxID=3062624 RepID=UPI000C344880|nr:PAS domain-containing hybrid sensor histidine kinase/response regulator [Psychrobium sp. 1_MG-2023]MDP2560274.1 PAS domain-containing hybrid sensor histidine kinase/response regulator [Psychrobium sp. 1_MG-2023]PKF55391.1 hybrid sensor histidine kinase/response regulator [Alteromonadales bacterium alter-6D02]